MIKRILPYFKDHLLAFGGALLAMALVAPLTAGSMWILKQVIDKALLNKEFGMLRDIVVLVTTMYALKAVLSYVHDFLTYYVGQAIVKKLRDQVYAHLHDLSMDFFTANSKLFTSCPSSSSLYTLSRNQEYVLSLL